MTTTETELTKEQKAAKFVIDTVSIAKQGIIKSGHADAEFIYAVCNKLSTILNLDIDIVIDIMTSEKF